MMIILFVEGKTEKRMISDLLRRWLDPNLPERVGISVVRFEGWQEFTKKIKRKVEMHLQGSKGNEIIAAIGLLDLYGPDFYPDKFTSVKSRQSWAVRHFEKEVDDPRFRMYFAVHEIEAWLLSQTDLFPTKVSKALPKKVIKPETVNFKNPPSKTLDKCYRKATGRGYKKVVYGNPLFGNLDLEVARSKCPYFKKMLDDILDLLKKAM